MSVHVQCIRRCCVSHMGLARETDVSCDRTACQSYRVRFASGRVRKNQRTMNKTLELLCCYAAEYSIRDGPGDHFMEDLRTGVTRAEVFRVHPSTFQEAVDIALSDMFSFRDAR